MKSRSRTKGAPRVGLLAFAALLIISNATPGAGGILVEGWSPPANQTFYKVDGTPETVAMQTAVVEIPGFGGNGAVRMIFRPSTGAVWIGLDHPGYSLFQDGILAARAQGLYIVFQRSTKLANNDEELARIGEEFVLALDSLAPTENQDDFAIRLADVFGLQTITRRHSSPAAHMVAFQGMHWVDGYLELRLATALRDEVAITFDGELQPWKARFNEAEILVVDAPVIVPKALTRTAWALPHVTQVIGKTGRLAARTRTANYAMATNVWGREIQFMTCVCEDGRVWIGPSGTDLVFTEAEVVGFFLNDRPPQAVQMFRSSVRLPLDMEARSAYKRWLEAAEGHIRAGNYQGQATIVELTDVEGLTAEVLSNVRADDRIVVEWKGDALEVRVRTAEPDGVIRMELAVPTMEFISGAFVAGAAGALQ